MFSLLHAFRTNCLEKECIMSKISSFTAEIAEKIGFNEDDNHILVTPQLLQPILKQRSIFAHKGSFGRALLIAGSRGMVGASVLASHACLRGGVGLLTVHAPRCAYTVLQTALPEAMVECDEEEDTVSTLSVKTLEKYTAVGIGPGLGNTKDSEHVLKQLLQFYRRPVVFDADALNVLADNPTYLEFLPKFSLLTPHLGELERLIGGWNSVEGRIGKTREFAMRHSVYMIVKGAFTQTISPDGICYFNTTGNPGMATAGSGDVLCGLLLSLLAQSYSSEQAAILGVFLHGLAGDLALAEQSQESLLSGDLVEYFGAAFKQLSTFPLGE